MTEIGPPETEQPGIEILPIENPVPQREREPRPEPVTPERERELVPA